IRDKLVTGVQTCALPIFAVRAPVVRNRHFVDHQMALQEDGEKLGVELEAVALHVETDQLFALEDLVAGVDVAQRRVVEHSSDERSEERRVGKEGRRGGGT